MADTKKYAQTEPFQLYGAGCSIGATSIVLTSFAQIDGTLLTMTDFGTKGYGTLEPGNTTKEESITFTGVTQNGNGTATLTGVSHQLFVDPYTETAGVNSSHVGGVNFVISNTAGFYSTFANKNDDETITGLWDFPSGASNPTIGNGVYVAPTADTQIATKKYADDLAIAGAPNATTTVKGIIQLPTQAQVDAKTASGSTGAALVVIPATQRSTLLSDYVADTGVANAYVITPIPAITSYTVGQQFSFKATSANTTVSTVNISGLGVKTIKKLGGSTDLASGDIAAGMLVQIEYDGTNFIMLNPVANTPALAKFGGTGSDGALTISSGTTTIDLLNASVVTKNYTSISITGTGSLAFTNPHANGTIVIIKSQGAITLTSSSAPMINMSAIGATKGAAAASAGGAGVGGTGSASNGTSYTPSTMGGVGGANNSGSSNAAAGIAPFFANTDLGKYAGVFMVGAGGGGGGDGGSGGANGGNGGGGLIIECAGAWNFTTTSGISVAGQNGSNGNTPANAGAGGGGGGGFAYILYNTLTSNSGTITISGGTGGTAGSCNAGAGGASQFNNGAIGGSKTNPGGDGGTGWSSVAINTEFV